MLELSQEAVINFVTVLGIFGIPSIFTLTMWCIKQCKKFANDLTILSKAQKAQMRSQLMTLYYEYKERGFVYSDELDDWENQYQAYHELVGVNGVLDAKRDDLLKMQTKVR